MPELKKSGLNTVFPLSVSAFFIILSVIAVLIGLKLQTRLFLSVIDHISFYAFLSIIVLFGLLWLIILVFETFSLNFGTLYRPFKWLLCFVYYPCAWLASKLEHRSKESLQTSFLAFQNQILLSSYKPKNTPDVLILLPHCLQFHDCRVRITRTIDDCEECGRCDISSIKHLGNQFGLKIGIANGGTLARKIVHDNHPDVIIAVACHRDLTSGVRETWKYPVYAILNDRPNGPCYDTHVCTNTISDFIKLIIQR
jgi:uncharacterized protein